MIIHIVNLILSRMALAISGIIFWWLAAQMFSASDIGIAASLISVYSMALFFSEVGMGLVLGRFLSQSKDPGRLIGSVYGFSFIVFTIVVGVFLLTCTLFFPLLGFIVNPFLGTSFFVLCFFMYVCTASDAVLISYKKTKVVLIKNTVFYFLRLGFIPAFISLGGYGLFAANCCAAGVAVIGLFWYYRRYLHTCGLLFDLDYFKIYTPYAMTSYVNSIVQSLPGFLFPLLVAYFFSAKETGYFYIPWMIFTVYSSFIGAILGIFFVEVSHKNGMAPVIKKEVFFLIGIVLSIGVIFFCGMSKQILGIFNKDFPEYSAAVLKVLFYTLIPFSINQFYLVVFSYQKKLKRILLFNFSMFVLLFSALFFAFPRFGALGIAYVWLWTNIIVVLIWSASMIREQKARLRTCAKIW